jgi:predicted methyltransferase
MSEMRALSETIAVARKILARLSIEPLRLRDVWKLAVQDSSSVRKTVTVFYWLPDNGFIRKTGEAYCAPYELTEKGRHFHRALN